MEAIVVEIAKILAEPQKCHICDVGANPIGGDAPYQRMLDLGLSDVTGFEPQPEAFNRLLQEKSECETYLPTAIGDGSDAELRIFQGSGFASFYDIDPETVRTLHSLKRYTQLIEKIPCKTSKLDDLDAVRPIDFLKIDVQGSELSIIQNAQDKLSEAIAIQTEVRFFPLYTNEPTFGELDTELRNQGFQLHDFVGLKRFKFNSPNSGNVRRKYKRQLLDGDAIYIRDLRKISQFSDKQLKNLGQLSLLVFESIDLTVFVLSELVRRNLFEKTLLDAFTEQL